jgi:single-strand DNA-binding protein
MQKNRIEIAGMLAAKPETRFLPSGTKIANARLAENYGYRDREGKQITNTNWYNLAFYDDLAGLAATYDKGENLFVEGVVQQRRFTPKDGCERTVQEIVVRSCHLIAPSRFRNTETTTPTIPEGEPDESWPVSAA